MKIYEIMQIMEKEFPLETAYEWDNCGLLLGDKNKEVTKIFLTLDVTEETAKEAVSCGADMIISHHPLLFGGTKRITSETPEGRTIMLLLENKISVYAAHTNCDVAKNGINARLAELFELSDVENLEDSGLGRIGKLKKEISLSDFAELVKERLSTPFVRIAGDEKRMIKTVAIGSGACSDSIPVAVLKGADVMLTADTKYHEMLNCTACGIAVIDAGHYPTEIIVTDIFECILKPYGFELNKSESKDIYKLI